MVKSNEEVIAQFKKEVNMTADELETWLKDPKSEKAGTGVGIESGHKIVEILRKNPTGDPEKYDDDDLAHMRKVVGYASRHLAQEDRLKETKTREELENTKSTISLKNWGHDPVKTLDEENGEQPRTEGGVTEDGGGETQAAESTNGHEQKAAEVSEEPSVENDKELADGKGAGDDIKKRKLGDDETSAGADASGNDTVVAAGSSSEADEAGDDEQEDRPRKKSKVDGESDTV